MLNLRHLFPRQDEQQPNPNADRAIRNVEGRKTNFISTTRVNVEAEKIDDVMDEQSIYEISGDATEKKSEGNLAKHSFVIEVVS